MTQAAHHGPLSYVESLLNTDGRPHPLENRVAAVALLLGAVAAVSSIFSGLHLVSSWAGLAGIGMAGWGQLISATTGERFATIVGLGASAVGFYLGMANGGLFGGVLG